MDQAEVFLRYWQYKERHITGPYSRVVYDVYIDRGPGISKYTVLRAVQTEELAAYICRMQNNIVEQFQQFG